MIEMADTAAVEVWAPAENVVAILLPFSQTPSRVNEVGSTEIFTARGAWVIGWDEADQSTLIVANSKSATDVLARRAFDELSSNTTWQLALWDIDGEVIAERPALATA